MLNGARIKDLLLKNEITKVELRQYIQVSPPTLDDIIKGKSTGSISTLEKIADFFHVSMDYFFDREEDFVSTDKQEDAPVGRENTLNSDQEIAYLRALLEEKERTIQILLDRK